MEGVKSEKGVVLSSVRQREKLILSMLNGYKQGAGDQVIQSGKAWWVVILLALVSAAICLAYTP